MHSEIALLPTELYNFSTFKPQIALGALDGRYREQVKDLNNFLSEPALNRARVFVEAEWLIFLCQRDILPGVKTLTPEQIKYIRKAVTDFNQESIAEIAKIEAVTRHDVKAIEYFLKNHLQQAPSSVNPQNQLGNLAEVVHIFCTSEDINNLAYALTVHDALHCAWLPKLNNLIAQLTELAKLLADVPMLARTHGQAATPVTLGKEIAVFCYRLQRQVEQLSTRKFLGKFNGATGTWAAHRVALPDINWPSLSRDFINHLGLEENLFTTQIESHDWQCELYANIAHINRILHNLSTDFWTYISLGYFKQRLNAQGSTGSSTMPHKVNPIRFENAEANLEISTALFETLTTTLATSRMQRDLTDSSTQRNIGVAFGHSLLALSNLSKGIAGLDVNGDFMRQELNNNWEVLGEAIQQCMRVCSLAGIEGMDQPYERLKELTRGQKVNAELMREFIEGINFPPEMRERLLALTPDNYLGYAPELPQQLNIVN